MQESKEKEVDQTTVQADSPEEKKDTVQLEDGTSQKTDEQDDEEKVTLSKKELETLRKKATDFDGIIEKKRLKRLAGQDNTEAKPEEQHAPQFDADSIIEQAKEQARIEASKILAEAKKGEYENNLSTAYRDWLAENKWADKDEVIEALSGKFSPQGLVDVNSLKAQLDKAARDVFPAEYEQAYTARIRAKVLAEEGNITAGDISGGGSTVKPIDAGDKNVTKEDMKIAEKYFNGDINRYLKYKQDKDNK